MKKSRTEKGAGIPIIDRKHHQHIPFAVTSPPFRVEDRSSRRAIPRMKVSSFIKDPSKYNLPPTSPSASLHRIWHSKIVKDISRTVAAHGCIKRSFLR